MGLDGAIGGFTIMNDWSARDVQRSEMKLGLGPVKGKDFATSLGPVVVTPDELGDLLPGDLLGSGAVGGGSILDHDDGRWLRPGDEVELEIEGIGVLRNTVGI